MKKLFSLLILLHIACFTAFSQTNSDSNRMARDLMAQSTNKFLTVKGIELKPGFKMSDMLEQLLDKGLKKSEIFDIAKEKFGILDLTGTFLSRPNCSIKVLPTQTDKSIVAAVAIHFPEAKTFNELKSQYDILKSTLSKKYAINNCNEGFDDAYVNKSTSNYLKLSSLEKNEGRFETRFCVSDDPDSFLLGQINLNISCLKVDYNTSFFVTVTYSTSDCVLEQLSSMEDDF